MRRDSWIHILATKLMRRLSYGKWKYMSIGSRVVMLNAILTNILIFCFSFYKSPEVIIQKIVKLQCSFLWVGVVEKRKVSWVNLCKSEKQEGLDVKDCENLNSMLLNKRSWRILTRKKYNLGWITCLNEYRCSS